jgi:hypothetical protein
MPIEFGTDGWVKSLRDELNASKGNLLKIMPAPRAALELVQCCTQIPTERPKA